MPKGSNNDCHSAPVFVMWHSQTGSFVWHSSCFVKSNFISFKKNRICYLFLLLKNLIFITTNKTTEQKVAKFGTPVEYRYRFRGTENHNPTGSNVKGSWVQSQLFASDRHPIMMMSFPKWLTRFVIFFHQFVLERNIWRKNMNDSTSKLHGVCYFLTIPPQKNLTRHPL